MSQEAARSSELSPAEAQALVADEAAAAKRAEREARYAKLRANVRKRRLGELLCILLAIAVFVATIVDITAVESKLKWGLIAAYAVLFIIAILLLISRRRQDAAADELAAEAAALRDVESQLLQCPDCRNVFRYGERVFHPENRLVFSCPYCGVFSRQPSAAVRQRPVPRPVGDILQRTFVDAEGEQFTVGIFKGRTQQAPPFRDVKIRGKGDLTAGEVEVVANPATPAPSA